PKPDRACAENEQPPGSFVEDQRASRGHDALLVDVDAGQTRHVRAGGNDDRLTLDCLSLAVGGLHLDPSGCGDAPSPVKGVDLVLLEQEGHAFDIAFDARVLELHHGGKIELRIAHFYSNLFEIIARPPLQFPSM